jgi:phage N-6-adenine-methyltransferase
VNYRAGGTEEGRPHPKDDWRTPPALFRHLDAEFGFTLDAACSAENRLCPVGLTPPDGLLAPWPTSGAVWLNPPYSAVEPWLERARRHPRPVVCLVPADTSTRWWERHVARAAAEVRFVAGRIRFLTPDGAGHYTKRGGGGLTTPSAVVIYRPGIRSADPRYSLIPREAHRCATT